MDGDGTSHSLLFCFRQNLSRFTHDLDRRSLRPFCSHFFSIADPGSNRQPVEITLCEVTKESKIEKTYLLFE